MCMNNVGHENGAAAEGAGDAVGVSSRHWFVAFVGHNAEKSCRDQLVKAGYEAFVASQQEVHYWRNGKRKLIEKVIIRSNHQIEVHFRDDEEYEILERFLRECEIEEEAEQEEKDGAEEQKRTG